MHSIMQMEGLDHTHKHKILSSISQRVHPEDRHLSPPPSPNSAYYQKPGQGYPPNRMRRGPPPTPPHNPHFEGALPPGHPAAPRQFNDGTLPPPSKCKKTLFSQPPTGHRVPPTNMEVPSFAQVYGDHNDPRDSIHLRNPGTHLYPGEKVPIRKVYTSVPVDEIIAKNAKLYSLEHCDGLEDPRGPSPPLPSPPLVRPQDETELLMRRRHPSMMGSPGSSGVWRPW